MNFSKIFILRPVMTILVMVTMVFLGGMGYFQLPVSDLPNVDYPTITVTAALPGANPETMANFVATPLEKEFMAIPGITRVTSSNTLGSTNIILEFEMSKSMDSAAQDVQAAITLAQPFLPKNLPAPPTYKKVNPADSPIVYIALTSDSIPLYDLYTYAYTYIGQRLSMIDGVAQVMTYGAPYAVRVQVDPGELATRGIGLNELASKIVKEAPNLPSGQLDGSAQSYIISANAQPHNAEQFSPIIVHADNQAPVRLTDLGMPIDSIQNLRFDLKYFDTHGSHPAVFLAVQRQPGANTLAVSHAVRKFLPELMTMLPAAVKLNIVFDRADSIEESVFEVKITLMIAFLLVVFVIFLYLGKAVDTIIPSLAIPISIITTFWFMDLFKFNIDNLSLLALTLATGFIVDDAIVVLENIVRHAELGESRWEAALKGSKQISFTVISMTISLIAVFIPMLFMGGLLGKILNELAVTMIVVILISGIVSLTLTPMLCSRLIAVRDHKSQQGWAKYSNQFNQWLIEKYGTSLRWILKHRFVALSVGVLSVVFSAYFFFILPKDFIPDDDMGFVIAFTQSGEGTSPKMMFQLQDAVANIVKNNPAVESFGSLAGFPQTRQGLLFIHLRPQNQRVSSNAMIKQLYQQVFAIPGINVFFKNIPLINLTVGPQARGAFQYSLQSLDTQSLYKSAEALYQKMMNIPGFVGVNSDLEIHTPQLNVEILRDQAALLGISAEDIENALLLAYSGNKITSLQTALDQYDVILELTPKYQKNPSKLNDIYLKSSITGQLVPLSAVAHWTTGLGPSSINHISQFPAVTISFSLIPGFPLGTAMEELRKAVHEVVAAES